MASLLEELVYKFVSDTTELKKGTQDAKKTVDTLNQSISATDKISQKVGNSFSGLIRQATGAFAAIVGVGAFIHGIKAAATYADRIGELSDALNTNAADLDAWGKAVKLNGGSVEGFQQSVQTITASLADFATKGTSRAAPFFKELGIRMTDARGKARDFTEVLPELASSFERLSKAESFGIGTKLGLDFGTITLLQRGKAGVDDFVRKMKELGTVTKEDIKVSTDFNDELDMAGIAFQSLFIKANSTILPMLTNVLKGFSELSIFMKKHVSLVEGGIIAIATALTYFLIPAMKRLFIFASPFVLITAAVVALGATFALLYEDIQVFLRGGNSLTGELIKKFPLLDKVVRDSAKVIETWKVAFQLLSKDLSGKFKTIKVSLDAIGFNSKNLGNIWDGWVGIFRSVGKEISIISDAIKMLVQDVTEAFKAISGLFQFVAGPAKEETTGIMGALAKKKNSSFDEWLKADAAKSVTVNSAQKAINSASAAPISSQTSNSIANSTSQSNRTVNVQTGAITIKTEATDTKQIAATISTHLQTQMRQTVFGVSDGVLA